MTSVTLPPEPDELDDELLLPEFELLLLFPLLLLLSLLDEPPHAPTPRAKAPATARATAPVDPLCIAPPSSSPIPIRAPLRANLSRLRRDRVEAHPFRDAMARGRAGLSGGLGEPAAPLVGVRRELLRLTLGRDLHHVPGQLEL